MRKYLLKKLPRYQAELNIQRAKERDRNYHLGGRSFYFFDFDDNVVHLSTPTFLFHKETGKPIEISTSEWAQHSANVGVQGPYKDYVVDLDATSGTYQRFRDQPIKFWQKLLGLRQQSFLEDLEKELASCNTTWKGPSWNYFYHAVYNQRPIAIITARGHSSKTIRLGFKLMKKYGYLPGIPNFLAIYPVNHIPTRKILGDTKLEYSVPELKQAAIRKSVEQAFLVYGNNPHHRFGMSEDDPENLKLIEKELLLLKRQYPENSFYIIDSSDLKAVKREVTLTSDLSRGNSQDQQLDLI